MGLRALLVLAFALLTFTAPSRSAVTAADSLLLYFSCDSLPAVDSSLFARANATAVGNPTVVAGKVGNAFRLNPGGAMTDAFYVGQWQISDPVTVTAWFQVDNAGANNYMKIVSTKTTATDTNGFEVQYNPANKMWTLLGSGAPVTSATSTQVNIEAGTWYHIAMVASGTTGTIYLNGADVTGSAALSTVVASPGKDVIVGGSATNTALNGGGVWHGLLDEVRIYGTALSGDQVRAVMAEANTVATPNAGAPPPGPLPGTECAADAAAPPAPRIQLQNMDIAINAAGQQFPGFSNDVLTMHRTANDVQGTLHDKSTLRIKNSSPTDTLTINSLTMAAQGLFTVQPSQALPATLAPNGQMDVLVTFVGIALDKTALRTNLAIGSNDPVQPVTNVLLVGLYMNEPQGGNELPLATIVAAFGFNSYIDIGWVDLGIEYLNHSILGDEVTSFFWRAADPSKPVWVRTLATFQPCCDAGVGINLRLKKGGTVCAYRQDQYGAQSILPGLQGNAAQPAMAECTIQATDSFVFVVSGEWNSNSPTSGAGQKALHIYPIRDRHGKLVPDTYVMGHDFSLAKGCCEEAGCANCDYQDNVYVFTNARPADSDTEDRSTVRALPIQIWFNDRYTEGLADSNGNHIDFPQYWRNVRDTSLTVGGYQPTKVTLDPTAQTLTIATAAGSPIGARNDLENAIRYLVDNGNEASFAASATIANPGTLGAATAGVFVGSDQDNFAMLTVSNNVVTFTTEYLNAEQVAVWASFTIVSKQISAANVTAATSLELFLIVDPAAKTITAAYAADGGEPTSLPEVFTLPAPSSIGFTSAGRFYGFGASAGILAYNPDGGASVNAKFSAFGISTCSGAANPPTPAPPTTTPPPTTTVPPTTTPEPTTPELTAAATTIEPTNAATTSPSVTSSATSTTIASATTSAPPPSTTSITPSTTVGRAQTDSALHAAPLLVLLILTLAVLIQ